MHGEQLRQILDAEPNAKLHLRNNNEKLISYRFDTGAEVAFDPRTTTKCSIFVAKVPERMRHRLGEIDHYPPKKPSTALTRVSPQLANSQTLMKIDLPSIEVAKDLLTWIRWA